MWGADGKRSLCIGQFFYRIVLALACRSLDLANRSLDLAYRSLDCDSDLYRLIDHLADYFNYRFTCFFYCSSHEGPCTPATGASDLISDFSLTNSRATSSLCLWDNILSIVQPVSSIFTLVPRGSQQAQEPYIKIFLTFRNAVINIIE